MPVNAGTVNAEVRLLLADLKKDVIKVEKNMNNITKASKKTAKDSTSAFGGLKKVLIGLGGLFIFKKLIDGFKKVKDLAVFQIKQQQQLAARIKSTGGAAGLTAKEVIKMAGALQKVTTFGDETIINAQNMLLTFTKIGKDIFPKVTETVLDMATAFGTDLKSSAIQLGKALNDPILGVTALRRVGVQMSDQQTEMIKKFVEVGDVASAQKIILGELETQVGGAARAAADGVGSFEQFSNTLGDLGERIGAKVVKPLIIVAKGFINLLDTSTPLEKITTKLAEAENNYSKALRDTKDPLKNVTDLQENLNEARVLLVRREFIDAIKEASVEYTRQGNILKAQEGLFSTRKVSLEDLVKSRKKNVDSIKEDVAFTTRLIKERQTSVDTIEKEIERLEIIRKIRPAAIHAIRKEQEKLNKEEKNLIQTEDRLRKQVDDLAFSEDKLTSATKDRDDALKIQKDSITLIVENLKILGIENANEILNNENLLIALKAVNEEKEKPVDEKGKETKEEDIQLSKDQIALIAELKEMTLDFNATEEEIAELSLERERQKALVIAEGNQQAIDVVNKYYDLLRDETPYAEQIKNEKDLSDKRKQLWTKSVDAISGLIVGIFELQAEFAEKGSEEELKARRKAFHAGKASRISDLIMSGIQAAIQVFNLASSVIPPPAGQIVGGILASIIGAKTLAGTIKIGAQKPGFQFGGVVPGNRTQGVDSVPINATPGEAVMTESQQAKLFEIANGSGGGSTVLNLITETGEVLKQFIFNATKNGTMQVHGNGIVFIEEAS